MVTSLGGSKHIFIRRAIIWAVPPNSGKHQEASSFVVQESYSSPSPFPNRRVSHHLHQSVLFEQRFLRISRPWPSSSDSPHQQVVSSQAISVFSIHFWLNKININNHLYLVTWICSRWLFTFYHGKSLWKPPFGRIVFTFLQASNGRKSKVILFIGSKTIGEWLELYRSTGLACYEGKDLSRIVFWWKMLPRGIETWIRNCLGYILGMKYYTGISGLFHKPLLVGGNSKIF